jgi:hypothetical protein
MMEKLDQGQCYESNLERMYAWEETSGAAKKCNNDIRDRGLKQQLQMGSKGNVNETFRQAFVLEIVKQTVGSSIRF